MTASESETQARLLAQALPFMQKYENKTIVGNMAVTPWGIRRSERLSRKISPC